MKCKLTNNIFFKSAFILLLGGTITRVIGFILKIIITRKIGTEGIALYSLLGPTTSLLTTISILSYPTAISTLISKNKYNSKNLIFSTIILSILINITLIIIVTLFSGVLSNNLLHEPRLYYPIICVSLTLPFVSISSIIKGYFWGKQNMLPYMISNIVEQIIRITLISIFITKIITISLTYSICFILIVNIIGEIISQIIMLCFSKKTSIKNLKINKNYIKDLLDISIPATSSKIVGSISYFLEPIILTNILLYVGYNREYILLEYGIIVGYSLSLLLMPQFFTQNMSTALIPELSKHYYIGNYDICKKRIKQIVTVSTFIGTISTLIILLFRKELLFILYNTNEGIDYIKLLAPFTILFYIEYPLLNALHALNKSKMTLYSTIICSIVRIFSIILFSLLGFGMYSLVLAIIINLITSTLIYYYSINKVLK